MFNLKFISWALTVTPRTKKILVMEVRMPSEALANKLADQLLNSQEKPFQIWSYDMDQFQYTQKLHASRQHNKFNKFHPTEMNEIPKTDTLAGDYFNDFFICGDDISHFYIINGLPSCNGKEGSCTFLESSHFQREFRVISDFSRERFYISEAFITWTSMLPLRCTKSLLHLSIIL